MYTRVDEHTKEKSNQVIMRIQFLEENYKKKCREIQDLKGYITILESDLKQQKQRK